jgi:hypothetical protein
MGMREHQGVCVREREIERASNLAAPFLFPADTAADARRLSLRTCSHTCIHRHTCAHTDTHTHTNTHTHKHTHTCFLTMHRKRCRRAGRSAEYLSDGCTLKGREKDTG